MKHAGLAYYSGMGTYDDVVVVVVTLILFVLVVDSQIHVLAWVLEMVSGVCVVAVIGHLCWIYWVVILSYAGTRERENYGALVLVTEMPASWVVVMEYTSSELGGNSVWVRLNVDVVVEMAICVLVETGIYAFSGDSEYDGVSAVVMGFSSSFSPLGSATPFQAASVAKSAFFA